MAVDALMVPRDAASSRDEAAATETGAQRETIDIGFPEQSRVLSLYYSIMMQLRADRLAGK